MSETLAISLAANSARTQSKLHLTNGVVAMEGGNIARSQVMLATVTFISNSLIPERERLSRMFTSGGNDRCTRLQLEVFADVGEYLEERVIRLEFSDAAARQFAECLALLSDRSVNFLLVTPRQSNLRVRLTRCAHDSGSARAWLKESKNELELELESPELEYWLDFFTTYVRRGRASVDHIDVETTSVTGSRTRPTTFVFKMPKADAPLSAEEATRRLKN